MPTYDYRCDHCGHEFELFQSMTAKVRRKCPDCGEPRLKRLIGTGGGVIFKGSGFYQTDYRSDSYKKAAEADTKKKDSKSDSEKKTKKDSDSKPSKSKSESKTKPESKSKSARKAG